MENIYVPGKYYYKPTKSPTQGQPNPSKTRFEVAFGPLFPTANNFSLVGIDFIYETDYSKPKPTKLFKNTLFRKKTHRKKKKAGEPKRMVA